MIQAITCELVLTSGAGISLWGPIMIEISVAERGGGPPRSPGLMLLGAQMTPPFAPPKGMPTTAHFQVIHIDRAFTSSNVTSGLYLMPPLAGPRLTLCWTR